MAASVAQHSGDRAIMEHDVVRLSRAIVTDDGSMPAGGTGMVVHIHRGGTAYEIEFDAPFHVVTILAKDVELVPA